jgi:hypothetical protein
MNVARTLERNESTTKHLFKAGETVTFQGKQGVILELYTIQVRWNPNQLMAKVKFRGETRGLPQRVLNYL